MCLFYLVVISVPKEGPEWVVLTKLRVGEVLEEEELGALALGQPVAAEP